MMPLVTQLADRLGNYAQQFCPECMKRFGVDVSQHLIDVHGYGPGATVQVMCAISSGARVIAALLIDGAV